MSAAAWPDAWSRVGDSLHNVRAAALARSLTRHRSPVWTERYLYLRDLNDCGGDCSMGRPYKCRYCRSTHTIWKGYRARSSDKVRLRVCRDCGRKFTSRQVVTAAGADR